ncbi:WbqC family protein [Pyramidobacter sp. YE332]|uniref:WbqC family protein n=1 Tax=Pyramidobacter sp. YE332 TaxID=3068894 RepID=UPI00294B627F|nr:WbqC family protein [Pyramidobacter sp. YE332]WOL38941.1 WbqC family protein [Pyramidobacter sp. YE332]
MRIGIMQPYFFPYLGYWQLMNAVDKYVVYDDVNFIKGGRINRNAILMQQKSGNINVILSGASPNKLIREVEVNNQRVLQTKLLRTIEMSYSKAPYYANVMPILEDIITQTETNLAEYLFYSFRRVGEYLGITTELIMSSKMEKDCSLKAHHKVISICKKLGATEYYNSISGIPLYVPYVEKFQQSGIELSFLKLRDIHYHQYNDEFVPNLSIIDVMMFNSREECQNLLQEYDLIKGSGIEL